MFAAPKAVMRMGEALPAPKAVTDAPTTGGVRVESVRKQQKRRRERRRRRRGGKWMSFAACSILDGVFANQVGV